MRLSISLALLLAALLAPAEGAAQKPKKEAKTEPAMDVGPSVAKVRSGDEAQIREGLEEIRIAGPGGAAAAPAVAEALSRGLSLSLTEAALETLADLEAEAGSPAIAPYTRHRNLKVRRAAVKALTRTKGPAAVPALRAALSDRDEVVRGTAASGLGSLKAKDAVPDLFAALDHRVNEAAASIGQLCGADQCEALAAKLGKLPFDVVTSGLDQILSRPELTEDAKIKVIGRLRELGTAESNKFLRDVQQRWPANGSKRVRQALDQAVLATSGGSK